MLKRFSFPLQKLLNYKEQLLESERIILADMNVIMAGFIFEQKEMCRQREERRELFENIIAIGITAIEMETHKNYLTALDFALRQKEQQIMLQQQAINRQIEKIRQAKLDVSTIEKLKERKREEYDYMVLKEEERIVEEFIASTKAMSNNQKQV